MGSGLIETGRPHTYNMSTEESYPSTEPRLDDWHGAPSHSSCWVTERSFTTTAPQASSSDAYPSPKFRSYCKKYTRGLAVTTQHLEPSLETPSDKVSTGQPCFINEVSLSTFTDMINKHIDSDVSVKLKGSAIADWLTVAEKVASAR